MATNMFFRNTVTHPGAQNQSSYRDMLVTAIVGSTQSASVDATTPATGERFFLIGGLPASFYSERFTSQVTISGAVMFQITAYNAATTVTGRLRAYLYKITAGGSNVETLIGQADAASDITGTLANYAFSFTPSPAVVIAPNERFIVRVSLIVTGGTGAAQMRWNASTTITAVNASGITVTEAVTVKANGTQLWLRKTSVAAIGTFFDLIPTQSASSRVDGIVNTAAGGTEIQWTRTAGGTVLEWISGRVKAPGWTAELAANFTGSIYLSESDALANVGMRLKAVRRKPDGTETLVYTIDTIELAVLPNPGVKSMAGGTLSQVTPFAEDDRLVLRAYIYNVGTMAGGFTATLAYDHSVTGQPGASFITLLDGPEFKAEGDPAGTSSVPGALPMMGVGN